MCPLSVLFTELVHVEQEDVEDERSVMFLFFLLLFLFYINLFVLLVVINVFTLIIFTVYLR